MSCNCISQVNQRLMQNGYVLAMRDIVQWTEGQPGNEVGDAPLLQVERINGAKGRKPNVYGPFCPFCGERRLPALAAAPSVPAQGPKT